MNDISSGHKMKFIMNAKKPSVVETIPGYQHYIKKFR